MKWDKCPSRFLCSRCHAACCVASLLHGVCRPRLREMTLWPSSAAPPVVARACRCMPCFFSFASIPCEVLPPSGFRGPLGTHACTRLEVPCLDPFVKSELDGPTRMHAREGARYVSYTKIIPAVSEQAWAYACNGGCLLVGSRPPRRVC